MRFGNSFEHDIHWNGFVIDEPTMKTRIAEAAREDPQPELHLRADRKSVYERVAQVMAAAQSGGLKKNRFHHRPDAMSAKPPNAKAATAPRPSSLPREDGGPAPIPSGTLLQGRDAITIEHNGRLYQLRKTRQEKLILTK